MSERFYLKDFFVSFTNGGGEALFEGLIELGKKLPEEKTMRDVTAYLQYRLDNFGYGGRFFNLENLPEELNDRHLAEFARLINLFCIELTKAESELKETGLAWSRDSRMEFLARLTNLYSLLKEHLQESAIEIPAQRIPLSKEEEFTVERKRLFAVYNQTKHRLSNTERLELWEKIISLVEADRTLTDPSYLSSAYFEYTNLIDETMPKEKRLSIWKRFLEIETGIGDEESIELIGGIIEDIENK